jgi:hypothetical protein
MLQKIDVRNKKHALQYMVRTSATRCEQHVENELTTLITISKYFRVQKASLKIQDYNLHALLNGGRLQKEK